MNGNPSPNQRKVNWWVVAGFGCVLLSSAVTILILIKLFDLMR